MALKALKVRGLKSTVHYQTNVSLFLAKGLLFSRPPIPSLLSQHQTTRSAIYFSSNGCPLKQGCIQKFLQFLEAISGKSTLPSQRQFIFGQGAVALPAENFFGGSKLHRLVPVVEVGRHRRTQGGYGAMPPPFGPVIRC